MTKASESDSDRDRGMDGIPQAKRLLLDKCYATRKAPSSTTRNPHKPFSSGRPAIEILKETERRIVKEIKVDEKETPTDVGEYPSRDKTSLSREYGCHETENMRLLRIRYHKKYRKIQLPESRLQKRVMAISTKKHSPSKRVKSEKPSSELFICKCGKDFVLKQHLVRHQKSHEPQFVCERCRYVFTRIDNLSRHSGICQGRK